MTGFFMDYWYLVLVLPAIIFSIFAQISVNSTFNKMSKISSKSRLTGKDAVELILQKNNITNVSIQQISGKLTDNYDPKKQIISLSEDVYSSTSVAALGIAAHEAGHACQYAKGYGAINARNAILPIAQIGSNLAFPLVIIGIIFSGFKVLITIGICLFAAVVVFQLITLPVEFNASNRAIHSLEEGRVLDNEELQGTRKVLSAAAMTYVAALAISLMSLLRLILISDRKR